MNTVQHQKMDETVRPAVLYKYLPAAGAISLLAHRQFWFRCPLQFEPFDSRADLLKNTSPPDVQQTLRQEMARILCDAKTPPPGGAGGIRLEALRARRTPWTAAEVETVFGDLIAGAFQNLVEFRERQNREQQRILEEVRVLCLCENFASQEMWDTYAEKGRGVCIGFRYVPEIDNSLALARRIQYVDDWPAIATPLEWARHILSLEQIPFGSRAVAALYVKLKQFSYEQEWRIVTKARFGSAADADGVFRVIIDPPEVVEIILGPCLSSVNESKLREIALNSCPHVVFRTLSVCRK